MKSGGWLVIKKGSPEIVPLGWEWRSGRSSHHKRWQSWQQSERSEREEPMGWVVKRWCGACKDHELKIKCFSLVECSFSKSYFTREFSEKIRENFWLRRSTCHRQWAGQDIIFGLEDRDYRRSMDNEMGRKSPIVEEKRSQGLIRRHRRRGDGFCG